MNETDYLRAIKVCIAACAKWKAENPEAQPKFQRLCLPRIPGGADGLCAGLGRVLEMGVAGNSAARKLLTAMDRATPNGGATVIMAEQALEQVFGIPHALVQPSAN